MEYMQDLSTLEERFIARAMQNRTPVNGSIELLPLCNMNCDMCYVRLSPQEVEKQGRIRTMEEWLDIAKQMQEAGVLFMLLTGGEPLLYPQFRELFLELKKMGMIITINTNGTLIDEEWAAFFGQHKPRRINITLYGGNEETYGRLCHYPEGFNRAMRGIQLLREQGVDVKINGSDTKANHADLEQILAISRELEVPIVVDTYMMPATREREREYGYESRLSPEEAAQARITAYQSEMGEEGFKLYQRQKLWEVDHSVAEEGPRKMRCLAGKASFTINWQGEMRPCVMLSSPAMSVFEHGFKKAWEHIVTETDKIILSSKCNTCELRPLCQSCAACALLEGGSYDAVPEYMCRYAEESLRQLRMVNTGDTDRHEKESEE